MAVEEMNNETVETEEREWPTLNRRGKGGRCRASNQRTIPREKLVILQNLTVAASRLTVGEIRELVDDVSEMSLRGPSLRSRPALLAEILMLVRPMEYFMLESLVDEIQKLSCDGHAG